MKLSPEVSNPVLTATGIKQSHWAPSSTLTPVALLTNHRYTRPEQVQGWSHELCDGYLETVVGPSPLELYICYISSISLRKIFIVIQPLCWCINLPGLNIEWIFINVPYFHTYYASGHCSQYSKAELYINHHSSTITVTWRLMFIVMLKNYMILKSLPYQRK